MNEIEFMKGYFEKLQQAVRDIPRDTVKAIADLLMETQDAGRTIYVIANGGSASTATHIACDLAKDTIVGDKKRLRAVSLVDNIPLVSSWTNDNGFDSIFEQQLIPWLEKDDVLIVVSVHGAASQGEAGPWSQNLVKAIRLAKERQAKVVSLSGFRGGPLQELSDYCITVRLEQEPFASPIIESCHCIIYHLITIMLKIKIENS
jgi:D-sedoheptulose 7-phosphate isomerase